MDLFMNDSKGERHIEDYLFGDLEQPAFKSTFGLDQQFAKPIEDEDLFGDLHNSPDKKRNDENTNDRLMLDDIEEIKNAERPFAGIGDNNVDENVDSTCIGLFKDDNFQDQENRKHMSEFSPSKMKPMDVDTIFVDDYSDASENNDGACSAKRDYSSNNNNTGQIHNDTSKLNSHLTPAQLKAIEIREKIKAAARIPKKISPDDADGVIYVEEHDINAHKLDKSTKFMFSKFCNARKVRDPLKGDCGKVTWEEYREALMKKICADKRKVWDSFQAPCDNYDEDEELIEEMAESLGDKDSNIGDDEGGAEDSGQSDDEFVEGEEEVMGEELSEDSDDARLKLRSKKIVESDDEDDNVQETSNGNFEDLEKEDAGENIVSSDEEEDETGAAADGSRHSRDSETVNKSKLLDNYAIDSDNNDLDDGESDFNDDDDDEDY